VTSVNYYRDLLAEPLRIEAFRRAVGCAVRQGDHVLEIGTGLGTYAFFAADAGAKKVWAIDGHPIVHVARAIARLNGYGDRVEFIRGWFPQVELGGQVDVAIVEDFPPRLIDACVCRWLHALDERHAVPGYRVVPAAARWVVAPVSSPALWEDLNPLGATDEAYGIDWSASRAYVMNRPATVTIPAGALLGAGREIGQVDFADAGRPVGPTSEASWRLDQDTVVHGLAYWFDLELTDGEWLSNAPGSDTGSWRHLFLPIDPPIEVAAGGTVEASVGTEVAADGQPTWLHWTAASGAQSRRGHEFAGFPASLGDLRAASPDGTPQLSEQGRRKLRILELADGRRTVDEIAAVVAAGEGLRPVDAQRLVVEALASEILLEGPQDGPERGDQR
jgi:hypothetical protein